MIGHLRSLPATVSLALLTSPGVLLAEIRTATTDSPGIEALRAEILDIRQESQREIDMLRTESDRKVQELLMRLEALQAPATVTAASQNKQAAGVPAPTTPAPSHAPEITGDFRLRYENNSSLRFKSAYSRGVVRGRLEATYRISDGLKLGARLVTGNPDDPRTADTTIGNFASDLTLSFDRFYAEYQLGKLMLVAGKFPKPFASSELVWDSDVNPQGFGGRYALFSNEALTAQLTGVYFAIAEKTSFAKSDMLGGQLSLAFHLDTNLKVTAGLAYYDYEIPGIEAGLPGGARGNNVAADGVTYVSDFDLMDAYATVDYLGFGEDWPLQLVANQVTNAGARVAEDSGYGIDLLAGHLKHPGAFKLRYGYSEAETDAVLGLFSHDNIGLGTNYKLHTFSVNYALLDHTFLGLTHYRFRQKDDVPLPSMSSEWANRTRLNLYFVF